MLFYHDPDEWKVESSHRTCRHHQRNPFDRSYAGCTCSFSSSLVRRDPEEIREIKGKRRHEEEERILAEAEAIRARRK